MNFTLRVDCYAGYKGEQEPRSFSLGTHRVRVASIKDRWLSPDHRYFKIADEKDCLYIIRHDMTTLIWELVYYKHPDI